MARKRPSSSNRELYLAIAASLALHAAALPAVNRIMNAGPAGREVPDAAKTMPVTVVAVLEAVPEARVQPTEPAARPSTKTTALPGNAPPPVSAVPPSPPAGSTEDAAETPRVDRPAAAPPDVQSTPTAAEPPAESAPPPAAAPERFPAEPAAQTGAESIDTPPASASREETDLPQPGSQEPVSADPVGDGRPSDGAVTETASGGGTQTGVNAGSGGSKPGPGSGSASVGAQPERLPFQRASAGAKTPEPRYPEPARRWKYQGVVGIEIEIGADGKVLKATVVKSSGHRILDDEALDTVKKRWRFRALGFIVVTLYEFEFRLKN